MFSPFTFRLYANGKATSCSLSDFFIEKYSEQNHINIKRISTPAIDLLMAYHWPGNVRELENCIERAVLLSTDEVIHSHHLPPSLQSAESTNTRLHSTLPEALDNLERELLLDSLKSTKGNMGEGRKTPRHNRKDYGTPRGKTRYQLEGVSLVYQDLK